MHLHSHSSRGGGSRRRLLLEPPLQYPLHKIY